MKRDTVASSYDFRNPPKPGPKVLHHLNVEEADNGGHIIEHHYENSGPGYHEPEQHVFSKGNGHEAMKHIAKHMGIKVTIKPGAMPNEEKDEEKVSPGIHAKVAKMEEADE